MATLQSKQDKKAAAYEAKRIYLAAYRASKADSFNASPIGNTNHHTLNQHTKLRAAI